METYFNNARNAQSLIKSTLLTKRILGIFRKQAMIFLAIFLLGMYNLTFSSTMADGVHPCDCGSYTTIGTDNTATSLDMYGPLPSNTCFLIHGTLVMDDDVHNTWSGSLFVMAEGSKIEIEKPLNIEGCYFSSCDNEMWVGISLSRNGRLNIADSYIEGAGVGISLVDEEYFDKVYFECKNTRFINDYIGIAVGRPWLEDGHDIEISMNRPITSCSFYTQDHLPDPYPGFYYEEWPTEPEEIHFNQGYAALYFSGVSSQLSFGAPDAVDAERNTIYEMRNGVILRNSVCDISGSDFYDFEGEIPIAITADLPTINQHAILLYTSASNIMHNTINNVMSGIHTDYSISDIVDNEMDIVNDGSNISTTYGVSAEFPQSANINLNTIHNGYHGIRLNDAGNKFEISDNVLNRDLEIRSNSGISILAAKVYSESIFGKVHSNDIEINDGVASTGIYTSLGTYLNVSFNNIHFNELISPWHHNTGILVSQGGQSVFASNNIISDPVYRTDSTNTGMLILSQDNLFTCNVLDNMHRLMKFYTPNTMTQLKQNEFNNSYIGLHLIGQVNFGPPQEHNLNKWEGYFYGYGAALSGPDAFHTAQNSSFKCYPDDGDPCEIIPCAIYPNVYAGDWFIDEENTSGPQTECPHESDFTGNDEDSLAALVTRPIEFTEYNEQAEWMIKADLFEMILRDPSLRGNHVLDSFYDIEEDKNLGKLVLFQNALLSQYGIDPDKDEKQDTLIQLTKDIHILDSILFNEPINKLTLSGLRNLKRDTLSRVFGDWLSMIEDQSHDSRIEYSGIQGDIALLTPDNDLEEYMIEALRLKSKCLLHSSFSSGDSTSLFSLVELCPMEGGRALGIAQDVYSMLLDSVISAYIHPCPEPSPFAINKPKGGVEQINDELLVWPNPVIDQIHVSTKGKILDVSLSDMSQHLILKSSVNSHLYSLNTSSLPPGFYLLKIITENGIENRIITIIQQ